MTDIKTIMYSMTTNSISGNFAFSSSENAFDHILFTNGVNSNDQTSIVTPSNSTTNVNILSLSSVNYGSVGSTWYFGKSELFDTISFHFNGVTSNESTRTMTWEFWNGSAWVTMSQTGITQSIYSVNGPFTMANTSQYCYKMSPINLSNNLWTKGGTDANGHTLNSNYYYVRVTVGVAAFTTASLQSVSCYDNASAEGYPAWHRVFTSTDNGANVTNRTIVARVNASNAFTFTANTTSCIVYFGSLTNDIVGFVWNLSTGGAGGVGVWEYSTGSGNWATLPYDLGGGAQTNLTSLDNLLTTGTTTITFRTQPLSSWATNTVGTVSAYWIRFRVTTNYSTNPIFSLAVPISSRTISRNVWIPENTNRNIQNAFIKLHLTNNEFTSPNRFINWARFDSGSFTPVACGFTDTVQSSFHHIGGKIFSTTANDGSFSDETTDASDSGTNDITITNSVNANIYFCYPNDVKYTKEELYISIQPNTNTAFTGGEVAWEYWNGSNWTAFEPIPIFTNKHLNGGVHTRFLMFPLLQNWTATTVNGFTGYIIRRRITQTYTTSDQWTLIYTSVPGYNNVQYNNSGENQTFSHYVDVTKLFQDTFTGTSHTFDFRFAAFNSLSFTGTNQQVAGELYITYAADEQNTRIKSVVIPLNITDNTSLTTSLASIGSNEIPQLSTYLPEASKTIRNFYIVVTGNDQIITPITTEYRIKVGSSSDRYYPHTAGGITGTILKAIYVDDNISTSTTHDIQMAVTSRQGNFRNWTMYAVVTYEYDASTTTRTINSIILPFETSSTILPQDDPLYPERIRKSFYIQEPGTINNVRIGSYISFADPNSPILRMKDMNESSYKQLTFVAPSVNSGNFRYGTRLSTTTLNKGLNTIGIDLYGENQAASTPSCYYTCGYFIVNYHSDVYSGGLEKHNKTISCLHQLQRTSNGKNYAFNKLSNPLASYFINDFGIWGDMFAFAVNATISIDNRFIYEDTNQKYVFGAGGCVIDNNEHMHYDVIVSDRGIVKKYPNDPKRPVNIFSDGRFLTEYGTVQVVGGSQTIASCHEITYTISGNITGSSGGTVDLMLMDFSTDEVLLHSSRVGNGSYSFTWYDDTRDVYVVAIESDTKKGISKQATAGSGFDIALDGGGSPSASTQKSYVWGS
jgi:hypothetical protein